MRLLLDTHAFLWFILDEPQLSSTARALIADPDNQIDVSPATYWEIAIKIRLENTFCQILFRNSWSEKLPSIGSTSCLLSLAMLLH